MPATEPTDEPMTLEVVKPPSSVAMGTLNASSPTALVSGATEMAKALADVIDRQGLYSKIQGRNFVRVEGWTTLATMMGCMPRERSATRLEDGGYEAVVDLVRMSDGVVLTSASAECGMDEVDRHGELTWANRPRYARRSMAITRATSKACRIAFSWVMSLAGYEVTPAEEMDGVNLEPRREREVTLPKRTAPAAPEEVKKISEKQAKLLFYRASERAKEIGDESISRETIVREVLRALSVEHTRDLTAGAFDNALKLVQEWQPGGVYDDDVASSEAF